jgi:hypothetical protein
MTHVTIMGHKLTKEGLESLEEAYQKALDEGEKIIHFIWTDVGVPIELDLEFTKYIIEYSKPLLFKKPT